MKNKTLVTHYPAEVHIDPITKRTVLGVNPYIWKLDISAPSDRPLILHFEVPEWNDLKIMVSRTAVGANTDEVKRNLYIGTVIPRQFTELYKKRWRQDDRMVLFPSRLAGEGKSQIVIVPQPHQLVPERLLKNKDETDTTLIVNVVIKSVSVLCLYWEEETEEWTDKGCQVVD